MWNSRPWLAAVAAFAFVASGCDNEEPIDARKVADVAATRSAQMLKGVGASMRTTGNLSSLHGLDGALASLGAGFEGVPLPALPLGTEGTSLFAPETTDAQAEQLARFLRERIFTEANVESSEGNTLLFRLKGSEVCTDGTERPDEGCVRAVDAAELRIRATSLGNDSLELELLIGPNRVEPMSLRFLPKVASFVVDLGGLKGAVAQLAAGMEAFLPPVMVGQVEFKVTEAGAQHWIFSTSILDALRLEMALPEGTFAFSFARAEPLMAFEADSVANRVRVALDLNTTEVRLPYLGTAPGLRGKDWTLSLAGLSYAFEATEDATDFSLERVGLGDAQSHLRLGDDTLFSLDLNAQSGRHFSATLTSGADGAPLLKVQPEFDLVTRFYLAPLKADPSMEIPAAYEDASYRLRLSGGNGTPTLRAVPANASTGFKGGLQLVTGELLLAANDTQVVVSQGQCLVSATPASGETASLLAYLSAGNCE
ncbi:hypothetical protein [Comamonas sp. JC664]|uniref:hypothetical protein n=1 Tax=Comamonas sp. JC664 TaxID=2801917 RepID=UPI00174BACB5|nr:hypothetical protein [Comamonas sp. JC664]MBL0692569.1 hypothetical protein [Comamonas sp. JC664]GHG92640.1 hypothetical protein GCM10012319_54310 [Comamonas sp. KCTC 72670]